MEGRRIGVASCVLQFVLGLAVAQLSGLPTSLPLLMRWPKLY